MAVEGGRLVMEAGWLVLESRRLRKDLKFSRRSQ